MEHVLFPLASDLEAPPQVIELIARGALFVINDSGGKDSQAMKLFMRRVIPAAQLLVIHAPLPEVEWDGIIEHIERYNFGLPFIQAEAAKTFFDMVESRQKFPSPQQRQCTSDLKRDPINREIRRYLKAHPEFNGLVVNCMGMRAEESPGRSKLQPWKHSERNSVAGREWYEWLPIHDMLISEVFASIAAAGQEPLWVYKAGMSRASCCFCIMAAERDLKVAAKLAPALYQRYARTERRLNFTLSMSKRTLPEITGVPIEEVA